MKYRHVISFTQSVNGQAKKFCKEKFTTWYSGEAQKAVRQWDKLGKQRGSSQDVSNEANSRRLASRIIRPSDRR